MLGSLGSLGSLSILGSVDGLSVSSDFSDKMEPSLRLRMVLNGIIKGLVVGYSGNGICGKGVAVLSPTPSLPFVNIVILKFEEFEGRNEIAA